METRNSQIDNFISRQFKRAHKNKIIGSIGTAQDSMYSMYQFADFVNKNSFLINVIDDSFSSLKNLLMNVDFELANEFINYRISMELSKSTVERDCQVLNFWLADISKCTKPQPKLLVKNFKNVTIIPRFTRTYTAEQIDLVCSHITDRNSFSVRICQVSNIRVHELLTLRKLEEQAASTRALSNIKLQAQKFKFLGFSSEFVLYSVIGKGGLIREIAIHSEMVEKLELFKLETPSEKTDRGINYIQHYDLAFGKALSSSFSSASKRWLGWSTGIHSLRHDYAKFRLKTLFRLLKDYELAKHVVSQELGHFRPDIADTYLY
ncbi:hypothetical protein [Colwellia sp. MB3u-4]|uniref:hypothetical protein n=1 Tax=Colwellia sp. MB3u-4 TaxID=2759822 RepID=UPI0015F4E801|nr:hypothetical protein [Colwellia sp. MB3u-4]MBA6289267.1 hypothetical protein [Colwellia sp. MB3u-4]